MALLWKEHDNGAIKGTSQWHCRKDTYYGKTKSERMAIPAACVSIAGGFHDLSADRRICLFLRGGI